ncbi:hypothetical protein U1Q18_022718 [Sarracenia purpurea var. burkii]
MDMELLGVHHNTRKRKGRKERVKVVYISSPVKVTTSASSFRALVQELTGRDSDLTRFVEANNNSGASICDSQKSVGDGGLKSVVDDRATESPTSSDSLFEPWFDDVFIGSNLQGNFLGMFPSNLSVEVPAFGHGF